MTHHHDARHHQSVYRTLSIMEFLATVPDASAEEIQEATGIPLSSIYRLISPCVDSGVLQKTAVGRYGAGPVSVQLAQQYRDETLGRGLITKTLAELSQQTGEMAAFMVPRGTEALCVESVESRNTLRCSFSVGAAQPLVRGATAVSLLSRLSEERRQEIFHRYNLGHQEVKAIQESCRTALHQGLAVSTGALDIGVWGVSSPVTNTDGSLRGTVTLMAPANRIAHRQQEYIRNVKETAVNLSGGEK
ncbi:IclR family transcriptional regulator [Micrococcaceae sp. AOP34-BR2-30]